MSKNNLFDMMESDAQNGVMQQDLKAKIGATTADELTIMDAGPPVEVTQEMRDWVSGIDWHVKGSPRDHQIRALFEAHLKRGHCYFVDPGGGKTFLSIAEACHLYATKRIEGLLVFAPNGVHAQWVKEEVPKWAGVPTLCAEAQMSPGKLKDFISRNNQHRLNVLAVNYEGLITDKNKKLVLDFMRRNRRVMLVVDESQKIKNWEARRTVGTMFWSLHCDYRRVLSGTPLLRGLEDLWSQYEVAQPGIAWPHQPVGFHPGSQGVNTYGFLGFRTHFCVMQQINDKGAKAIVGYQNERQLMEQVAPYVTRVKSDEFSTQPEPDFITVPTPMGRDQMRAYAQMEEDLVSILASEVITAENALVQMGKLLQISSGFTYSQEIDETRGYTDVAEHHWLGNNKIDAAMTIMENLNEPVLIWAPHRALKEKMLTALREKAQKDARWARGIYAYGEQKDAVDLWREDPRGILLGNQGSGMGVGLNLQHAAANIYLCNTFSAEARWQSIKRSDRMGQTRQVRIWDLVTPNTLEGRTMESLARKEELSRLNVDGLRRFLR